MHTDYSSADERDLDRQQLDDGRPRHAQALFAFCQFPAFLRHLPEYFRHRRIKHVNPKKHYVWLFDNIAFRSSSVDQNTLAKQESMHSSLDSDNSLLKLTLVEHDPWQVEYTAAFFHRKGGRELAAAITRLAQELNSDIGNLPADRVRDRIQHFVDAPLNNHVIHSCVKRRVRHLHGPSDQSGFATMLSKLVPPNPLSPIRNYFPGADRARCFLSGETIFAEPEGWGVISDIDDTIKVTLTESPVGVLQTTFLDEPVPVSRMPELYNALVPLLENPTFFYLSASPYNLYPFLRTFRQRHFPFGPILLRETTWQSIPDLFSLITQDVQKYKTDRIERIRTWFPQRKFLLIGDTTQKDPETYGDIARQYKDWIEAIFIRRVQNVAGPAGKEDRWADERFEAAFQGVDRSRWHIFDDPKHVMDVVRKNISADRDGRRDSAAEQDM